MTDGCASGLAALLTLLTLLTLGCATPRKEPPAPAPAATTIPPAADAPRDEPAPPEIRVRHVFIPYEGASGASEDVTRTKEQAQAEAAEVRTMALQGSDFFDLARRWSSCPTAEKGGDLGRFGRGVMTRPFEEAAFALKVNEIGPVVETEFGFHVIQRTE